MHLHKNFKRNYKIHMNHPEEVYKTILEGEEQQLARLRKQHSFFGWMRLFIVVATAVACFYAFGSAIVYGWLVLLLGFSAFIVVLRKDTDNNRKIANTQQLIDINKDELLVLQHQFRHRFNGAQYETTLHAFAQDLDLFGPASLYQYINRCNTEMGRLLLANNFLNSLPVQQIKERQEAAKELGHLHQWRQQFQAYAAASPVTIATQQRIENWLLQKEEPFKHKAWRFFLPFYATVTLSSAIAAFYDSISASLFSFLFVLYFIFSSLLSKRVMRLYTQLSGIVTEIKAVSNLIVSLEKQIFQSILLKKAQVSLCATSGTASKEIAALEAILGRFDLRLNTVLFLILNSFLLWDVRQARALNNWKTKNKSEVKKWFAAIAETETLVSLGTLYFNQPQWATPQLAAMYCQLKTESIGHPLLPESVRVTSDFEIEGQGKIALITGSNMAGKSTFLRSLGINIVLAQMGASVCAKTFVLSPVKLMSSMRIADDLSENTSTFYAELKKLKSIIEAVNANEPVFILLDEILRGTNSLDRHSGSEALIRQLIKQNAVAVLATHDVGLAALSNETPERIENYHFDVQVANEEELYFDYKLKKGVCQSLNATILMRKIGIEM